MGRYGGTSGLGVGGFAACGDCVGGGVGVGVGDGVGIGVWGGWVLSRSSGVDGESPLLEGSLVLLLLMLLGRRLRSSGRVVGFSVFECSTSFERDGSWGRGVPVSMSRLVTPCPCLISYEECRGSFGVLVQNCLGESGVDWALGVVCGVLCGSAWGTFVSTRIVA